jgi:hypothetical protein
VYKNKTVDNTADSFTTIILQAMDLAIPWNTISKPKLPHWFFSYTETLPWEKELFS